jgi:hypothetical protein
MSNVKKYLESERPQLTIWRMRITCWITKATNMHSEYAIFIASAQPQYLHDSASLLRCTYIAYLVNLNKNLQIGSTGTYV